MLCGGGGAVERMDLEGERGGRLGGRPCRMRRGRV